MKLEHVLALFIATVPSIARGDQPSAAFRDFAKRAIENKTIKLRPPSFEPNGNNLQYDLGGWENSTPGQANPTDLVLVELFRAEAIRRDGSDVSKKLATVLNNVDDQIAQMLDEIDQGGSDKDKLVKALRKHRDSIDQIYLDKVTAVAKGMGKETATLVKAAQVFRVQVKTVPAGGIIRYMPALRWDLYLFRAKRGEKVAPEWTALTQFKNVPLSGKYRFEVTWPTGAKFEDFVEVVNDQPVELPQPAAK